jgi:hypothetical protein
MPSKFAMIRAAERIGPDVLVRLNQEQLAKEIDRAMAVTVEHLKKTIKEIDEDERYHYPTANVVINAPLTLIQVGMETKSMYAQQLLALLEYEGPELDVRPGPQRAERRRNSREPARTGR